MKVVGSAEVTCDACLRFVAAFKSSFEVNRQTVFMIIWIIA